MITLVLVFASSAMQYMPQPTFGAVVIAAALSWPTSPEHVGCGGSAKWIHAPIIALLGVALLGVLPGILVAVGLSILDVFRRA